MRKWKHCRIGPLLLQIHLCLWTSPVHLSQTWPFKRVHKQKWGHFSKEVTATKRARRSKFGLYTQVSPTYSAPSSTYSASSHPFLQASYNISGQNTLIHSIKWACSSPITWQNRSSFAMLFKCGLNLYIIFEYIWILFKISLQTICHSVAEVKCSHNIKPDPG